jgi:hypothetical protein
MSHERIHHAGLLAKLASAEQAAALIQPGETVAMSGFTGSGYPKAVPLALAARIEQAHAAGQPFQVKVLTGASTAPELDGALAKVDGMALRLPFQTDPIARQKINDGKMDYIDMHLSHVAQQTWFGIYGELDTAIVEVSAIREDGRLVPSTSVGNNKTWLDLAKKVIIEVNLWQPEGVDGMHDIYYGTALPPDRKPIPLVHPEDRIGEPYLHCDPDKVVAVVLTNGPTATARSAPPTRTARDRRPPDRVPQAPGRQGPPAEEPAAAAVRRGQHPQRGAGRAGHQRLHRPDRLHRGHPGRHAGPAEVRRAAQRLVHRLRAQPRRQRRVQAQHRFLPRAHRDAHAGDLQPPRAGAPPGLHRHERHDRGGHLRQRQLHP